MPRYKVTKPRFWGNVFREPGGKHDVITTDKKIPNCPKDLVLIDEKAATKAVEAKSAKNKEFDLNSAGRISNSEVI